MRALFTIVGFFVLVALTFVMTDPTVQRKTRIWAGVIGWAVMIIIAAVFGT